MSENNETSKNDMQAKSKEQQAKIASLNDSISELQNRFANIMAGTTKGGEYASTAKVLADTDFGSSFERKRMVIVRAPTNIAFVKYWGKKNVNLNTPINNSLSATLDPNVMHSETTVKTSAEWLTDTISINGAEYETVKNNRVLTVLKEMRFLARRHFSRIANEIKKKDPEADLSGLPPLSYFSQKLQITTSNNFPTAAGLASSASGFAALTYGCARLFGIAQDKNLYPRLTEIARQGSGSACRSMYGGFVEWEKGEEADGCDSIARQLEVDDHWPELRFVVCVVQSGQKKVPSTQGMIRSQKTSGFLEFRSETFVDKVLGIMKPAIGKRNFPVLSELIMRDSNQLHAVCLDTFPPLEYSALENL